MKTDKQINSEEQKRNALQGGGLSTPEQNDNRKENKMRTILRHHGCRIPFASMFVFHSSKVPHPIKDEAVSLGFKFIS